MCKRKYCKEEAFDARDLCLPHLKASLGLGPEPATPKRKSRKKVVDNEELLTTDDTDLQEERDGG